MGRSTSFSERLQRLESLLRENPRDEDLIQDWIRSSARLGLTKYAWLQASKYPDLVLSQGIGGMRFLVAGIGFPDLHVFPTAVVLLRTTTYFRTEVAIVNHVWRLGLRGQKQYPVWDGRIEVLPGSFVLPVKGHEDFWV